VAEPIDGVEHRHVVDADDRECMTNAEHPECIGNDVGAAAAHAAAFNTDRSMLYRSATFSQRIARRCSAVRCFDCSASISCGHVQVESLGGKSFAHINRRQFI